MSVETIGSLAPFETESENGLMRTRRRVPSTPAWLLRITIESFFIVLSILAAFAVENWRDNREKQRVAVRSLEIFEREIRLNLAAIEDLAPYHSGILNVVSQARTDSTVSIDVRTVMDGLQIVPLRTAAWQTALGTGVLTYIDVETVWHLSLIYSMQQSFVEDSRAKPQPATLQNASREEVRKDIADAYSFMNALVSSEQNLKVLYEEMLRTIQATLQRQENRIAEPDTVKH